MPSAFGPREAARASPLIRRILRSALNTKPPPTFSTPRQLEAPDGDQILPTFATFRGESARGKVLSSAILSSLVHTLAYLSLSTPQDKLVANLMAPLAEFEHDLLRERVRRLGYRPSEKYAPTVVQLSETEDLSQREIAQRLGISKSTVNEILKRYRAEMAEALGS